MIYRRTDLTADQVRTLLAYDPETGVLTWRQPMKFGQIPAGSVAGHVGLNGYRVVNINRTLYPAHRLIWLMVTGIWPGGDLDHADGQRANNRWSNLREVTRSQNNANSRLRKSNAAGVKGVYLVRGKRWRASIRIGGRGHHLGYFATKEAAAEAYAAAANDAFGPCARAS